MNLSLVFFTLVIVSAYTVEAEPQRALRVVETELGERLTKEELQQYKAVLDHCVASLVPDSTPFLTAFAEAGDEEAKASVAVLRDSCKRTFRDIWKRLRDRGEISFRR